MKWSRTRHLQLILLELQLFHSNFTAILQKFLKSPGIAHESTKLFYRPVIIYEAIVSPQSITFIGETIFHAFSQIFLLVLHFSSDHFSAHQHGQYQTIFGPPEIANSKYRTTTVHTRNSLATKYPPKTNCIIEFEIFIIQH